MILSVRIDGTGLGFHDGNYYAVIRKLKRGGYSVQWRVFKFQGYGYAWKPTQRFETWEDVLRAIEAEGGTVQDVLRAFFFRLPGEERELWREEIERTKTFHVPKRKLPALKQATLAEVLS